MEMFFEEWQDFLGQAEGITNPLCSPAPLAAAHCICLYLIWKPGASKMLLAVGLGTWQRVELNRPKDQ